MTVDIISWSISTKVWDRAGIELATPGIAVRHASETGCEKVIKYSASHAFYHFFPTCLINSIKHEHSFKILYIKNMCYPSSRATILDLVSAPCPKHLQSSIIWKQCRSRSAGFWWSQLIRIDTFSLHDESMFIILLYHWIRSRCGVVDKPPLTL